MPAVGVMCLRLLVLSCRSTLELLRLAGHPLVREHIKALKSGHQGLPTKQMQQQPQQQLQPLRR
jgi:hypothetical protein